MIYGNRVLLPNMSGNDIIELQDRLSTLGYPVPKDGKFTNETATAIKTFQAKTGLESDGVVGPLTFKALEQASFPSVNGKKLSMVITLHNTTLQLLLDEKVIRSYFVAIGKDRTPTPLGSFTIIEKIVNPGGILGSRWMGLSKPGYGIHGTSDPSCIGTKVSNGCIRMHNWNVETLYQVIEMGTPVTIVT